MLEDPEVHVRIAAVKTLGKLEPAALAPHVPALARLLDVEEARLPFDRDTRRVSDRLRALLLEVLARPDLPHQPDPEVAAADVLAIIKAWGDVGGSQADLNGDLLVDVQDLLQMLEWYEGC